MEVFYVRPSKQPGEFPAKRRKTIGILEKEPDVALIISDWNMPEMDGFELLKWVRTNEATKSVPFLMATGRGEKDGGEDH